MYLKTYIILFLVLVSTNLFSQKLDHDELIKIQHMDLIEISEFLLEKGWRLDDAKAVKQAVEAGFAFKDPNSQLIIAYISIFDPKASTKLLAYTTFSFSIFQDFKRELTDYSIVQTGVEDNSLYTTYQNEKNIFKLEISSEKIISENIYSISLMQSPLYNPSPRK